MLDDQREAAARRSATTCSLAERQPGAGELALHQREVPARRSRAARRWRPPRAGSCCARRPSSAGRGGRRREARRRRARTGRGRSPPDARRGSPRASRSARRRRGWRPRRTRRSVSRVDLPGVEQVDVEAVAPARRELRARRASRRRPSPPRRRMKSSSGPQPQPRSSTRRPGPIPICSATYSCLRRCASSRLSEKSPSYLAPLKSASSPRLSRKIRSVSE